MSSGGGGSAAGFGSGGTDASRGEIRAAFAPVLATLGQVELVHAAAEGIRRARQAGGIHVCFAYPHELPADSGAETVPIFGLGHAAAPELAFNGDAASSWRASLARAGRAGCFSTHAAAAIRGLMGPGFPVAITPPPLRVPPDPAPPMAVVLQLSGVLLDTAGWATTGLPESRLAALPCASPSAEDVLPAMALHAQEPGAAAPFLPEPPSSQPWRKTPRYRLGMIRLHLRALYREALHDLLPPILTRLASRAARALTRAAHGMLSRRQARVEAATQPLHEDWQAGMLTVTLDGLVFAAVHGAWDPSWHDLLTAFVTTCRAVPRATLVVKTGGLDALARAGLPATLRRLGPFACRVVILDGNLAGGLDPLIAATSFYVCASHAEAAPLPMMRFLAAGRPAISPTHSALADLLDGTSGLPVAAGPDYDVFPGDSRERLHARAWRLDWESLCAALDAARTLSPPAYAERSLRAAAHLAAFCDHDRLRAALAELLATPAPVRRAA